MNSSRSPPSYKRRVAESFALNLSLGAAVAFVAVFAVAVYTPVAYSYHKLEDTWRHLPESSQVIGYDKEDEKPSLDYPLLL